MSVAKLRPYRSGAEMPYRGKIGNTGGSGVSRFRWTRVGSSLLLRGKDCDSKVVYGFPYREGANILARTVYRECGGAGEPVDCNYIFPCFGTLTITGFNGTGCIPLANPCFAPNPSAINGSYSLIKGCGGSPPAGTTIYGLNSNSASTEYDTACGHCGKGSTGPPNNCLLDCQIFIKCIDGFMYCYAIGGHKSGYNFGSGITIPAFAPVPVMQSSGVVTISIPAFGASGINCVDYGTGTATFTAGP